MKLVNKLPKWLPALVLMLIIFAFSNTPSSGLPTFNAADFVIKKGAHMLGYALLALSYLRTFDGDIRKRKLIWLWAILYAATDEFHQSFIPGRQASFWDVAADVTGALIVTWYWYLRQPFPMNLRHAGE